MKRFPLIAAAVTLTSLTTIGHAHAFLDHADPPVGSQIAQSPPIVKIWFTEEIEPAFSTIAVFDANGKQIDKQDSHVDADNAQLLIVSLPSILAGEYKVVWHVVASDTHKTQGDFKFTVKPTSGGAPHD